MIDRGAGEARDACPKFINSFAFSEMHYSPPLKIGKRKNEIVLDPSLREINFGSMMGMEKRMKRCEEGLAR